MDDMKDKSIHFTAQKLTEEIQNMPSYKKFYSGIQVISGRDVEIIANEICSFNIYCYVVRNLLF